MGARFFVIHMADAPYEGVGGHIFYRPFLWKIGIHLHRRSAEKRQILCAVWPRQKWRCRRSSVSITTLSIDGKRSCEGQLGSAAGETWRFRPESALSFLGVDTIFWRPVAGRKG